MNKSNAMPHSVGAFLKGVGIADVKLDSNNHLLVYLDNGKVLDAGQIPASDDALDATSERPVQNKIITAELDRIVNTLLAEAVSNITTLQQTKVDKISGKGLSTKDFTSAHEAKLNSLYNYDDTTLRAELTALSNRLTALVGGNANEAINSFNEIIAFLKGVEDSDSLNGILAGIGTRIAAAEARITAVEVKQREIEGAIADYDAQIESLGGRVDAQYNEINLVKGNQQTASVQISALQQRMNVAEDDIDSLEIKTATNAGSITSLTNRLSKAEALTRKVEDGSVVVENTLSEVVADSDKPVSGAAVEEYVGEQLNRAVDGELIIPHTINPEALRILESSKNLFTGIAYYEKYLGVNGEIYTLSDTAISDFIPFTAGTLIPSVAGKVPSGGYRHCVYDIHKNFIKSYSANDKYITWEEGVAYARFTLPYYANGNIQVEQGEEATPYTEPWIAIKPQYIRGGGIDIPTVKSLTGLPAARVNKDTLTSASGRLVIADLPKYLRAGYYATVKADIQALGDGVIVGFADFKSSSTQIVVKVDNQSVSLGMYDSDGKKYYYYATKSHGLSISNYLSLAVTMNFDKVDVVLISNGVFRCELPFESVLEWYGQPFVECVGEASLTNIILSGGSDKYQKPIWIIGDSYTSLYKVRWTYQLMKNGGIRDFALIGLAGGTTAALLAELKKALFFGTPSYLVWCLGMNDTYEDWVSGVEEIKELCKQKGITLILATIPTTPTVNNEEITTYVRSSGLRYIDFYSAVGSNVSGDWKEGYLSGDNVHPTEQGAIALCAQVLADLPELLQY